MAETEVVELLREIRDLQKTHIESYKEAVQNQEKSIQMQKQARRSSRVSLLILFAILIAFFALEFFYR